MGTAYLIVGIVLAIQTALVIWGEEFNKDIVTKFKENPNNDLVKAVICLSFVVLWPIHLLLAFMVNRK